MAVAQGLFDALTASGAPPTPEMLRARAASHFRQALAVLRATAAGADTPEQNAKAARSAIFAVADTITELQKHQEGRP